MPKPKVFIYSPIDKTGESHERITKAGCELLLGKPVNENLSFGEQAYQLSLESDTSILVGVSTRRTLISRETMEQAPNLRLVAKYTVGVDNVDVDAATDMGILVTHSPTEANWGGVAEGVMAYMLALLKKVRERDRHVKEGGWRGNGLLGTYLGRRLDGYSGITIGIVGLGRIGARLADLLAPWRVRLLACDPYVDESKFIHHNAEPVNLETLLKTSDVVTLHCNLTEETTKLISADQLNLMKSSAMLINASRGLVVDVDALHEALEQGRIASAVIDVLPVEPPDPKLPLFGLGDKVLISPHMITYNEGGGIQPSIPWVTEDVLIALKGEIPKHVYNEKVIPAWIERFGGKNLLTG